MAKKGKASAPAKPTPLRGFKLAPLPAAALLFAATAVAAGAGLRVAVERLRQQAAELPQNRLTRANLHVTETPKWIAGDFTARVLAAAELKLADCSVADRDLPVRLAQAFGASPWVKSAHAHVGVGSATVELTFRKPVLMTPWADKACYVAEDGVVLPPDEADREWLRQCLVLAGVEGAAPPAVGEKFKDRRVSDAAVLAGALAPIRVEFDLLRIKVLGKPNEPFACELHTVGGSVVNWGVQRAHDMESKIGRLRAAAAESGKLHEGKAPLYFDLTAPGRTVVGVPLAR